MIQKSPETIQKFVSATLKAVAEVRDDPKAAAIEYVTAVPAYEGREALVDKVLSYYAKNVYPGQASLGTFDPTRIEALQDYYAEQDIIRSKSDVDDLYTNQFIQQQ